MWMKIGMLVLCIVFALQTSIARALDELFFPVDVVIDAGHGGIDSGTLYEDVYEKAINLQVAQFLYEELEAKGYRVVLDRTGDYALSDENEWLDSPSRHRRDLAQRRDLVKELSPKIVVSLHVNWSKNPRQRGPLVLYQKNNQSVLLADLLQQSLNDMFKTRELPIPGRTYYLLNHSLCPTVIVEMGFISNRIDREILTSPEQQRRIAQTVAAAIDRYFLLLGDARVKPEGKNRSDEHDSQR
ncbi:N-acetylmuramoyl-L-alanine amidase CwlD [Bacillaceae bacterium]